MTDQQEPVPQTSQDAEPTAPPTGTPGADPAQLRRWRDLLASERESAALYDRVADSEVGERAQILRELAEVERQHAAHWERRLVEAGAEVPSPTEPGWRTKMLGGAARWLSTSAVLGLIERAERADAGMYDADPDAAPGMAADERGHAKALTILREGGDSGPGLSAGTSAQEAIGHRERWHRGDHSGTLRAAVFGISDGLVSNTALVMGFAGSGASRDVVLLAGIAGLLAGAFSMAAGEYVSMAGQREMFEREIALEATELEENPEEELEELVLLYRAKGLTPEQARGVAERIMADREVALDTLAREELGIDPDELGSPWKAAGASLVSFAIGAVLVVLPYLIGGGRAAFVTAVGLAVVAMFVIGAGLGLLNGRSILRSGLRQTMVGSLAAAVTFAVGALIGATV
jgi:VIT1/CCC1 family predicted Fe2+/Mn2+ transporter